VSHFGTGTCVSLSGPAPTHLSRWLRDRCLTAGSSDFSGVLGTTALGADCFGDVLGGVGGWGHARRGRNLLGAFGILCTMKGASEIIGHRVLVYGMMGSGKSTFARALAARTGLPVIHLDVHYWKPGWVRPSDGEWRERQGALLAGKAWIIDGNYNETLALRLERADTVVFLDTPWWLCACRAFVRGLRKPVGEMPEGCEESVSRRLRDEWGGVGRIWRNRRSEPEYARSQFLRLGSDTTVHVLNSQRQARAFLDAVYR
jgi:adenylate kinase family enzyme